MSLATKTSNRRRLVDHINVVGLAIFIGFSISAFGQAALAVAGFAA